MVTSKPAMVIVVVAVRSETAVVVVVTEPAVITAMIRDKRRSCMAVCSVETSPAYSDTHGTWEKCHFKQMSL